MATEDARIVQVGIAKVETTIGVLSAFIGVSVQTWKLAQEWDATMIKDFGGFDVGWDARNSRIVLTAAFKLTAASLAAAIANGAFLTEYAQVTITNADLPVMNTTGVGGFYTGSWCYIEGASVDLSNEQPGGMEIKLRKYKDPTQNSQQFVIPS